MPLGGVGPIPSHTSSSQPLLPRLSVGSRCRWRSGVQKHNLSLVHIRNQVLKVLVSWHSTLLNCSCWSVWLLLLPPPFSCHLRCSALPIMPGKPWYLLSLWCFFFFFSLFWDPAFSAGTWGILFHLTHNKGFLSLSFLILTFGLLTALFSLLSHVLHECPHCLSPNQPLQDGWRAFLQLSVIKPHAVSGTLLILFCITYQEARWEDPVTAEDDHAGRTIFSSCTSRCKLTDESL